MLWTSGGKGKGKELNLTPIDEDEDLHEMGIHDSGHFLTIDTLDDDDLGEEDLSWNNLLQLLFHDLVMDFL